MSLQLCITLKKHLYNIIKLVFTSLLVLVINVGGFATDLKTGDENVEKPKNEKKVNDPANDKVDSVKIAESNKSAAKTSILSATYNPELYLKQDTVSDSGSVITFNYIQYIVQNFKFAQEMY